MNVRKISAILLVLFSFSGKVHGQAAILALIFGDKVASENFHLSMDGGINLTGLPGLDQSKYTPAFYFGLGTFIKLSDRWSLAPEFKPLSGRGARQTISFYTYPDIQEPETKLFLNYIDVPVLLQYKIKPQLVIGLGPQVSFLTSAKQITKGETNGNEVRVSQNIDDYMEDVEVSIPVQVGYSLSASPGGKALDIKVRYGYGLNNVFTDEAGVSSRNSTWQIFLSFPFIAADQK